MSKPKAAQPLLNEGDFEVIKIALQATPKEFPIIFLKKKFDEEDESLFKAISLYIAQAFGNTTHPEEFNPKQQLIFQTLMQIFTICRDDQSFRELFFNEQNLNAKIIEILRIKNVEPEILEKPSDGASYTTDLIRRLRSYEGRSIILRELELDVESLRANDLMGPINSSEILARSTLDYDAIDDYIAPHYQCQTIYDARDKFSIKFTPIPEAATRRDRADFATLLNSLLPMARCEGEAFYTKGLLEIKIFNPEDIFVFYDRTSKGCGVGSLNMLMSSIYRNAILQREFSGEKVSYEKLVSLIFKSFIFNEKTEKLLRDKLLHKDCVAAFHEAIETGKGFDLDLYRPNNKDLEGEILAIHKSSEKNLLVAFYGKDKLLAGGLFSLGLGDPSPRRLILKQEMQKEFPSFPGIGLRFLGETSVERQYEFFISNPILARKGIEEFREFFAELEKTTTAEYLATLELEGKMKKLFETRVEEVAGGQLLRYALYGETALLETEDALRYQPYYDRGYKDYVCRVLLLDKEPRDIFFHEFPGIGLRKLVSAGADSKQLRYEFYITDPSAARGGGLAAFDRFFRNEKEGAEKYIRTLREKSFKNLSSLQLLIVENLVSTELSEAFKRSFDIARKTSISDSFSIKIPTKNTDLAKIITDSGDSFKAIKFKTEDDGSLTITIHKNLGLTPLMDDLKFLGEIISDYNKHLAAKEKADLAAKAEAADKAMEELLKLDEAENSKKGKKGKKPKIPSDPISKAAPSAPAAAKKVEQPVVVASAASAATAAIASAVTEAAPKAPSASVKKAVAVEANLSATPPTTQGASKKGGKKHKKTTEADPSSTEFAAPTSSATDLSLMDLPLDDEPRPDGIELPAAPQAPLASAPTAPNISVTTDLPAVSEPSSPPEPARSDSSAQTAAKPSISASEFDRRIAQCLDARRRNMVFDPAIINSFPQELLQLIKKFNDSKQVAQSAIYGGFIYGRNPKDLDFQVVVSDDFFSGDPLLDEAKLAEFFPPELQSISKFTRAPTTQQIWACNIGNQVEGQASTQVTFIRESDHRINNNWTSDIDARIFNLRSGAFEFQPNFLHHIDAARAAVPIANLPSIPININSGINCFLRVIYARLPEVLLPQNGDVISALARTLRVSLTCGQEYEKHFESSGAQAQLHDFYVNPVVYRAQTFAISEPALKGRTFNAIGKFYEKHQIAGEEKILFDYSLAQVLRGVDAKVFAEEIHRAESVYLAKMLSEMASRFTPPQPSTTIQSAESSILAANPTHSLPPASALLPSALPASTPKSPQAQVIAKTGAGIPQARR